MKKIIFIVLALVLSIIYSQNILARTLSVFSTGGPSKKEIKEVKRQQAFNSKPENYNKLAADYLFRGKKLYQMPTKGFVDEKSLDTKNKW